MFVFHIEPRFLIFPPKIFSLLNTCKYNYQYFSLPNFSFKYNASGFKSQISSNKHTCIDLEISLISCI